ncbi:hypothetical protein [Vannielia sp.]|uniref:hypothetical protein n=1 Tax=Vannielia sp. TaxID=2813045 RepID=UPI002636EB5E|nr:hypothetical protein [Vannielia sp.]MDF1873513.1 hypothetical protein [Vannielia sp.]
MPSPPRAPSSSIKYTPTDPITQAAHLHYGFDLDAVQGGWHLLCYIVDLNVYGHPEPPH